MKKILIFFAMLLPLAVSAQEVADTAARKEPIVLPPLFDYPVAPEDMDWVSRSNWLARHFWDSFDFKTQSVGQQQLNHAFDTWVVPLNYADKKVCEEAVTEVVKKLEKNPTLLLQFTRAAEAAFYSVTTAQLWIDEAYLPFVRAFIANKKIPATHKTRYIYEEKRISNSLLGEQFPALDVVDRWGEKKSVVSDGKFMLIEFGDPSCSECQMARIAMKADDLLNKAKSLDLLTIAFIMPDADMSDTSWMSEVADYPSDWIVAAGEGLDEIVDIKLSPGLFLVDPYGRLVLKNVDFPAIRTILGEVINQAEAKAAAESAPETEEATVAE